MNRPPACRLRRALRSFTIVEVMVSATILALGIVGVVTVSQSGLQAFDTARNLTAASQLMQSEMERVRLMSWAQLQALQDSGERAVALDGAPGRYACTREIRDVKTNMKEIVLIATWKGYDGRPHTARLVTRYGRTGLNDYFYTAH